MKVKKLNKGNYLVRVDLGEEINESLVSFLKLEEINFGAIRGIGAAKDVELGYLDMATKQYVRKKIDEELEILSLSGNITNKEGAPFLHMHGVFSDREFRVHGGHFFKGTVSCTGEFTITLSQKDPVKRHPRSDLGFFEIDI